MHRSDRATRNRILLFLAFAAVAVLGGTVRTSFPPSRPAGKQPSDWFYRQRAYPGREIPQARYLLALEQARRMHAEVGAGGREAVAWEPAGPTNIMGRVTCVTAHPDVPGRIFLGAAAGGVFRSTDEGASWEPVLDSYGAFSMGALATDPQNPDVVYAGTGEPNASGDSYSGIGLLRTSNGGDSWEHLGLAETQHIARVVVDPTDPSRIWVAAMGALFSKNPERGIYRSDDGGESWVRSLFVSDSTGAADVAVDPANPSVVYAAMWERIRAPSFRRVGGVTSGIWKTTDAGESWERLGNGLPAPAADVGRIGLALAPSAPSTVYAIYADHPGYFDGVYKTTDSGASWNRVNDAALSDLYSSFGWYFGQIRVDPADPDRVFVLGVPLYRTTNGGSSWSNTSGGMHVDHHALWIDPSNPDRIIEGNDGGLYRSTNGGSSWIRSGDLPITQFYAITVDEQLPERLYGGTQDNGTLRTLSGGLDDWELIYGGDGFYCLVEPENSNVIYAEYQYGGLGKSTNGGSTFYSATDGISWGDRRNWSTPVVMDPSDSQVLYYGTYRVYRTTNGAANWSPISGDLTGGPGEGNLQFPTVTAIAVAPSDPATVYAGTDDGHLWVTTNTGGSWNEISAGLTERWITRVAVDLVNRDVAYVTLSGYKVDDWLPHVFRTTDRGTEWTDVSGNLPDAPANDILIDPDDPSTLYLGTDFGVFVTRDLGGRWDVLGAGLPLSPVHDLFLHQPTRTLTAGTHGRSMFRLQLPEAAGIDGIEDATPQVRIALGGANPFRDQTEVSLDLPRSVGLRVEVVDVSGRLVRRLAAGRFDAGVHRIAWDGRDGSGRTVVPGVYFVRMEAEGRRQAVRVVRVRE